MTPLNGCPSRRRVLYLHKIQTNNGRISMPSPEFEPQIQAFKRLESYTLESTATAIGQLLVRVEFMIHI
jgi:hypothetical protein